MHDKTYNRPNISRPVHDPLRPQGRHTAQNLGSLYISNRPGLTPLIMTRAHSFPRPAEFSSRTAEFGFSPRNLSRGIAAEFVFFAVKPRNLTFFIRTTIFSQKMTSKYRSVTSLFMMIFCLMVMVE